MRQSKRSPGATVTSTHHPPFHTSVRKYVHIHTHLSTTLYIYTKHQSMKLRTQKGGVNTQRQLANTQR